MNKKLVKGLKIAGIVAGAGALLAGGALINHATSPYDKADLAKAEQAGKDSVEPKIEYVDKIVEKPVEVIKEVEVDSGNLDLVLNEIYDNNGNVAYLTDDLDDDEIAEITDRVVLVNDFKALAISELKKNLFDELDGEVVGTVTLDEGDMERLRINDEADEISVDDIDFEDGDAELTLTGTFEQDDIEYEFEATVSFKDGEVDEIDSITVN